MDTLLLVEPETLVRTLLRRSFLESGRFKEVLAASGYDDAVEVLEQTTPDLLITELVIRDASGIELTKAARKKQVPNIIILSNLTSAELVREAIRAGATAYLGKQCSFEQVIDAISKVGAGQSVFQSTPSASDQEYIRQLNKCAMSSESQDPLSVLTPREKEVFFLLTTGLKNVDIAKKLFISTRTVETHRARIAKKLDLHSTVDLLRYAFRHGLAEV